MRYGVSSPKEILKAWGERNYRFLMLAAMFVELALLGLLATVEVLEYFKK
jgi:hypothetical protein